jgi:hypothetical protein
MKSTTKYLLIISLFAGVFVQLKWAILETIVFSAIGFLGRGLYVNSFIYLNEIGG